MMDVEVLCSYCRKKFLRSRGRINEALKFGWKQYCSWECLSRDKDARMSKICATCNKEFRIKRNQISKSKSGRHFCSQTCAAKLNNHLRARIKPVSVCTLEGCGKPVNSGSLYCSRACANSRLKKSSEQFKKEVLAKIIKFHKAEQRIPTKKEMYGIYRPARRIFGSWNKAIETAGFSPNPVMFAKKYVARDGHVCDSLAEKIIDEWFYSKGIPHKRSVPYPDEFKKMTCDFVVGKYFIEFFGLEGEIKRYTKHVNLKRELSKKYNLNLIEIKPKDLFPKNKLNQVLSFLM